MTYLVIISCLFCFVQDNYYSDRSLEVAQIQVEELSVEGDSLYWAMNWISRANYKHALYERAYKMAFSMNLNKVEAENLKSSLISLRALVSKNTGRLTQAEEYFKYGLREVPTGLTGVRYRLHLNYADFLRLNMDYKGREHHLLMALSLAEKRERNKVVRVLARHYFQILGDFESAKKMMDTHGKFYSDEGRAGYLLLLAQYNETQRNYEAAREFYLKAKDEALSSGFVSFGYEAVDGAMRSEFLGHKQQEKKFMWYAVNSLVAGIIIILTGYNWWKRRQLRHE